MDTGCHHCEHDIRMEMDTQCVHPLPPMIDYDDEADGPVTLSPSLLADEQKIDSYMRQFALSPALPTPSADLRHHWHWASRRLRLQHALLAAWRRYALLVSVPLLAGILILVLIWMALWVQGRDKAVTVISLLALAAIVDFFAVIVLYRYSGSPWPRLVQRMRTLLQLPTRDHVEGKVLHFVRSTIARRPEKKTLGLLVSNITLIVIILLGALSFMSFQNRYGRPDMLSSVLSAAVASISTDSSSHPYVSRGEAVFDQARTNSELKIQAAQAQAAGELAQAAQDWERAILLDPSDAEALIYRENIRVLDSHKPYVSLVVGAALESEFVGGGRDILQGAYMMQKNWNHVWHEKDVQLLLLVANSGIKAEQATLVAQQIVLQAQRDKSIVGVIGWPTSGAAIAAVRVFEQAHLPLISPAASSTELSGISRYFFRVAPTDAIQGKAGALYAYEQLKARRIVVFYDPLDAYSRSLESSFVAEFKRLADMKNSHVTLLTYKRNDVEKLAQLTKDVQDTDVDLIYFAGYVNDASVLLKSLPDCTSAHCLNVLGGDALFVQGNYSLEALTRYNRLRFTAFAYPVENSRFVQTYSSIFDPGQKYIRYTYGHNYPDADAILAYKAMLAITTSMDKVLATGKKAFSSVDLCQALSEVSVSQTIFGQRENFSFDAQGDITHTSIVVLEGKEKGVTAPLFTYSNGSLQPYKQKTQR